MIKIILLFFCIFVANCVAPPPIPDVNGAQAFRMNQISQTNGVLSNLAHGALAIAAINSLDPCKYFENITGNYHILKLSFRYTTIKSS